MVERYKLKRMAGIWRALVAMLALSSMVLLSVERKQPPRFRSLAPYGLAGAAVRSTTASGLVGFAPLPELTHSPQRPQSKFPALQLPPQVALVDCWAGPSLSHLLPGRVTRLEGALFSDASFLAFTEPAPGILSGLPLAETSAKKVAWTLDELGLGVGPSSSSPAVEPVSPPVEPIVPTTPLGVAVAQGSQQMGRWLVGDFSSPASAAPAPPGRWTSPPALLATPQITSSSDRLAFAMPLAGPMPPSQAPPSAGWLDWMEPHIAQQIGVRASESWLPQPAALVEQIAALTVEPEAAVWAKEALQTLAMIERTPLTGRTDERQVIEHLAHLSQSASQLADSTTNQALAVRLRQAGYALWRRADCWNAASKLLHPSTDQVALASSSVSVLKAKPVSLHQSSEPTLGRMEIVDLLAAVERYEANQQAADARQIARTITGLELSDDPLLQGLATSLDGNYRNANLRVSLAQDFLDRWVSQPQSRTQGVVDRIVGTPVRGQAHVTTNTKLQLVANPEAWQVVLQTDGTVVSSTIARQGNVSVSSLGNSSFFVAQQLLLDHYGIRRGEAVASATSSSRFLRANSPFDPFPIVSQIIRHQARDRFAATRQVARREIESKTANGARGEFESRVGQALEAAEVNWRNQVTHRLADGGLELELVECQTTESRLISRLRLLESECLTSHTPRPRAPFDSLASLQLHESALRGIAATLQLDGASFTTDELACWLSRHLGPPMEFHPGEPNERATIKFAHDRAVDVALRDGQLQLTLSIYELIVRDIMIRDFKVHSYFTPRVDGLRVALERTEGPYFEGTLRNRERMQLHAIFNKNLHKGEQIEFGGQLLADPRLAGLAITQLVIDDGWLGIALGPQNRDRLTQFDRYQAQPIR